jgi:hypothetical protein
VSKTIAVFGAGPGSRPGRRMTRRTPSPANAQEGSLPKRPPPEQEVPKCGARRLFGKCGSGRY